jgi:predicted TIM-barrel fold metal-dependent hydrolase
MTTRRTFLRGAAGATGVAFCGCGMLRAAQAQGTRPAARQAVEVNGRRVKTIDVHAHCFFEEVAQRLGPQAGPPRATVRGNEEAVIRLDQRLAAMDAQKVDMEVLSVNPYWYGMDAELARQVVAINNERMAAFCAENAERFAGFCSLTLQRPELAVQELETAMRRQGLKGAAIGGNVGGTDFADPRFHPVWAKAE